MNYKMNYKINYNTNSKKDNTNSKKGFVLSLDSVFALIISLSSLLFILSILQTYKSVDSLPLQRIGMDTLTILEEKNSFFNQEQVAEVFDQTNDQICLKIDVYRENIESENRIESIIKTGCEDQISNTEYKMWRTIYSNGDFYYAQISVWLNKGVEVKTEG